MTTGISTIPFYRKPAIIAYWVIIATVLGTNLSFRQWEKPDKIIRDDVNHYYAYLPATFIYHDLRLNFIRSDFETFSKHFWPLRGPKDQWVIFTTMGLSVMYAPFFIVIHYPLLWMGLEAKGFSAPYQFALVLSSLFYFALGLHYLRRVLDKFYSQWVTAITLFAVVLATNLFFYVSDEPAMSHAYNFALMTVFMYCTIRWNEKPGVKYSIILGLLSGLIALIRPTNSIIVLILIFWNISSWNSMIERVRLFISNFSLVIIMILAAILVWIPQMIYWKSMTGQFLFFSYGDKGKFFFSNPQIINTLLGYRKGWLVYTPVMVFSFIGLFFLWKKYRAIFWPVTLFMAINIWVISSWWLWWYGGSFGLRAYIDSYGIVALPFAAFITWAFEKRHFLVKSLVGILLAIFTFHNFFQIAQYQAGAIDYVSMTREAYWDSFGHIRASPAFNHLLSFPDYKSAEKGIYPEPVLDPLYTGKLTRREGIARIEKELRSSTEQMALIEQKSIDRGIQIDSMIYLDAVCVYETKVSAGIVKPAEK